jgi:hypothetical protein
MLVPGVLWDMSMALAHFAFGAGMTVLVVAYLLPRVPYPRVLALLGGGWAMLPDVHWVSPVFRTQLRAAHGSVLADVFWLHRTMDILDPTDANAVGAGMVAFLLVATALAERRQYRTARVVEGAVEQFRPE